MPCKSALIIAFFCLVGCIWNTANAQEKVVYGTVTGLDGQPIPFVNIYSSEQGTQSGTSSDEEGNYTLNLPGAGIYNLVFSHITFGRHEAEIKVDPHEARIKLDVTLGEGDILLNQVEIQGSRYDDLQNQASGYTIDPVAAKQLPSAFGDFSKILVTLPGVVSTSELSSSYSVRGGNYDENLIFVNDMPVYRPLIYQSGQQEGLSFVNPDLVDNIEFYAGGWQPEFGDKLSSVLNVEYKKPTEFEGSVSAGLLGMTAHAGGAMPSEDLSYLAGFRYKNARYLLNTLDVDGEYLPEFIDFQALVNKKFGDKATRRPELNFLFSYAENDYEVLPVSQETDFGTFDLPLRLFVAYAGTERLRFRTFQTGLRFTHWLNRNIKSSWRLSGLYSFERDYKDVEGAYRLCVVNKNTESSLFDACFINRGVGSNYEHRRNLLDVAGARLENSYEVAIDNKNEVKLGWGYARDQFDDRFNEYNFTDSSDFVSVNRLANTDETLHANQFFVYGQHHHAFDKRTDVSYGMRLHYHSITSQWTVNPRLQASWKPAVGKDLVLRLAAGMYHQPPYYKEFRQLDGQINTGIKAQSSAHYIAGFDYEFQLFGRPFKMMTEAYYKQMWNVIPYVIENVNIRYLPGETAKAFTYGLDWRISGEFIPGDQSWFSLGVMRSRENIDGDGMGYIPRPIDQLVNAAIFFQDHIPAFPDYKIQLNYFVTSSLPFYTPSGDKADFFRGDPYQRLDIGFFKYFDLEGSNGIFDHLEKAWLGVEVLNLFGISNTITYTWIQDVSGNFFASPNTLSQRYFNVKLRVEF